MTNINKPICTFKELKESYQKTISVLATEKEDAEKSMNVTINALKNKLKEAESRQSSSKSHHHGKQKQDMPMGTTDPKQLKLYFNKIDELSKKNSALQTENKSFRESLDFYRSSSTKVNTNTQESIRLAEEKEKVINELEAFKAKYEKDINALKEEIQNNKLLLIIKQEKDKINKELQELNKEYQIALTKNQEIQKENEALAKKLNEFTKAIHALNNEKDKYKMEYLKIVAERKSLIAYLNEAKETYEKEIISLNEKLIQNELMNQPQVNAKKKISNELTNILIDYLTLKYCNKYTISILDILPLIINKQSLFKLYQSNKIEMSHFLLNIFSDLVTLCKYNPKCNEEVLLNKFNFFKPKDNSSTIEETLDKLSSFDILDFETIKTKYFNKKNFLLNNLNSSLETIDNMFNKDKSILLQPFPDEWINKENKTSYFNEIELVNYSKSEIYYYIQFEMGQLTALTLKGNFSNDYVYYILLNCDNLSSLTFLSCDAEDHLPLIVLFIDTLKQLTHLSIMNCDLTDDTTAIVLYSLKNNQSIKSIALNNDHLSPDGLFKFSDCLITNNTIISIDLSNNDIRELESFLAVINSNNRNLSKLNLSGNPLSENDFFSLGEFLNENVFLRHLDISRTSITQKSANHFRISLSKNKSLEELLMNECQFDEDSITIVSSQKGNYGIKSVEINNTILTEGCLMVLCSAVNTLKALQKLYLKKTEAKGIGLVSLFKIIEKKEEMKELHLEGNEIDENAVITFSTGAWNKKVEPKIYITKKLVDSKFLSSVSALQCIILLED